MNMSERQNTREDILLMKRICAVLMLMAMLITALSVFPVMADESDRIASDKSEYLVGEPIIVTATGTGADWVGLYLADDTPQAVPSIRWYYVAGDGNVSGQAKNVFEFDYINPDRPQLNNVPAGSYKLVLLANDGYEVLAETYITVKPDPNAAPDASTLSAHYKSADKGKGRADGAVTIQVAAGATVPSSYVLRWGNAGGPIKGYTAIAEISADGNETVYQMTPNTLIPAGADRVLVYAKVGESISEPVAAMLQSGAGNYDLGEVLYELQVMSDIHINANQNHIHNQHFAAALADIRKLSPNSLGIFVNGDVADHGQKAEYDALQAIIENAGEGVPPLYAAIGNHDFDGGQSAAAQIRQFLSGTGCDSETVYFDRVIEGVHFVFLGSEAAGVNATLSKAQLDWLEETLEADKAAGRPVFLFLHQGIMDTVAGTFAYQGWHGVNSPERLKSILAEHPEVIMFAGHSHWVLESEQSIKPADDQLPTVLNTSSCAYLWDDGCMTTNVGIVGSQGYYIYVYEDRVVFRGRNFDTGEWIASAQFVMDWTLTAAEDVVETTAGEDATVAEPVTESDTPAETDGADVPQGTEPATEETVTTDAVADQEGGCASALASGVVLTLFGALAAAFVLRRKE